MKFTYAGHLFIDCVCVNGKFVLNAAIDYFLCCSLLISSCLKKILYTAYRLLFVLLMRNNYMISFNDYVDTM